MPYCEQHLKLFLQFCALKIFEEVNLNMLRIISSVKGYLYITNKEIEVNRHQMQCFILQTNCYDKCRWLMLYLILKKYLINTRGVFCFEVILQHIAPIEYIDPHFSQCLEGKIIFLYCHYYNDRICSFIKVNIYWNLN